MARAVPKDIPWVKSDDVEVVTDCILVLFTPIELASDDLIDARTAGTAGVHDNRQRVLCTFFGWLAYKTQRQLLAVGLFIVSWDLESG